MNRNPKNFLDRYVTVDETLVSHNLRLKNCLSDAERILRRELYCEI